MLRLIKLREELSMLNFKINNLKCSLKLVLAFILIQGPASAFAQDSTRINLNYYINSESTLSEPNPQKVVVNPDYLRHRVLENNLSLEQELNNVKMQKDKMNIARAQLLPSLNLGMFLFGGPAFMLSSISFLLPFLFPSNWMALDSAADEFNAQKISYKIMEMNVFGSALAMYYTVLADVKVQKIYEQQAQDLMDIYNAKKRLYDLIGTVSPEDLQQTLATAQLALASASQLKEMTNQEVAGLRQIMGLPLATIIEFDELNMPSSTWENKPIDSVLNQAILQAPENQQIDYLIKAAQANQLSATFGFLNQATMSSQSSNGQGATFGNMTGAASFHFGIDYFPNLSLSAHNVDEVKLQRTQLDQQLTQTLESVLGSLVEANKQYDLTSQAEKSLINVYNITKEKYDFGKTSLVNVLVSHAQIAQAAIARVKAEMDLNQQRVNLHRVLVTDQFSLIKGCQISPVPKKTGLGGIFHPNKPDKTLDQLCAEGGSKN
jgi:outer membrane protein, multidrug efflux system